MSKLNWLKKKHIWILVLAILALVLFFNKETNNNTDSKPIVKIGAILPITGRVANMGEGARNAIAMALNEVNNKPNNKYHYEILFEDDMLEAKKTALASQKLININKVTSLITYFSGAGLVTNPIATQNKVIHFGDTWHPDVAKGHYNFIHFTQIKAQVEEYIKLIKYLKVKKLAIITESRAGSIKNAKMVEDKVSKIDSMDIASFNVFHKGEKQFTTLIEKVKDSGADYYYIQALSPELEILVKQMHNLGIPNEKISTIAYFGTSAYKELFNGSLSASIADYAGGFYNRYIKLYNIEPSYGAAFAYDIVNLIHYGFENAELKDGKLIPDNYDVVNTIHSVKVFDSAVGEISIDKEGIVHSQATFRKVENGKMVSYKLEDIK